ncbi:beta-lactamase-like protein [Aspergillus germanicus]
MTPLIKLSLLPSGSLTLPTRFFCADKSTSTERLLVPSMSFLLQHPSGKKIVFDLGIRRNLDEYPASIQPHLVTRQPIYTVPDVCDSLRQGGLNPAEIDAVILSHVHYDHVGTPSAFSNAMFIVGNGTRGLLQNGMAYHSAAHFEADLLPDGRTVELPLPPPLPPALELPSPVTIPDLHRVVDGVQHAWRPLNPFPNAIDLFGDGSFYIVDSPGHLVGHLNVLAKVRDDHWVYLAGDACHHPRLLTGEAEMAEWEENGALVCIHENKKLAEETLRRIRRARNEGTEVEGDTGTVEVVLAHDAEWFMEHAGWIFPGFL